MLKEQYPFIDNNGNARNGLIKHWTDDPEHKILLQVETGAMYEEAIDLFPCVYTYKEIDRPVEEEDSE